MSFKVLITTSGTGSRLGELTDFTNKSLIRVGNKPSISYIIENYPTNVKFVITLGHYGNHVREFLEMVYPDRSFEFVIVDKFKGLGSSLVYSILQAKENLQCPFIFHACDTILSESYSLLDAVECNFCIGSEVEDSSQYSTLMISGDEVVKINEKGELNYDAAYVGVCGIKDYELFWHDLDELHRKNNATSSLFEGNIINKMLNKVKFSFIKTSGWFDTGNVGELEKARKRFAASAEVLEKKEESIYFFKNHVVKFFHNQQVAHHRVNRGRHLGSIVPKIVDFKNNFYKYEKVHGELFSKVVTADSFSDLLYWSKENLWKKKDTQKIDDLCYKFYVEKTISRINKYTSKYGDTSQTINGLIVPKATELLNEIDNKWLCSGVSCQFHGDFILDNILQIKDGFCLLDWRQDFGGHLEIGDIYYDLAKLNHNLVVNHEIVNKNLFDHTEATCHILCNSTLISCKKILQNFVEESELDFKKVEVLTSLIWINMAPLHEYPFDKFLFNFGKYNLARCLRD